VLKSENNELLQKHGKIVFLRASISTLSARLKTDSERPLLATNNTLENRLRELLAVRTPIYERVADYIVDVDGKTPEEIAEEIIKVCKVKRLKRKNQ
jgi:shikimate kinase